MTPNNSRRHFGRIGATLALTVIGGLAWRGVADWETKGSTPTTGPSPAVAARAVSLMGEAEKAWDAGDADLAISTYKQVVEADPNQPNAWLRMGQIHLQLGRAAEAVDCFQKAARLDPLNYAPQHGLSTAYRALGRHEEAEQAKKAYDMRQMMYGTPPGGMGSPAPPAP